MSRNDFIEMLENKVKINRRMIGEIYELVDIFPYFQSAHLLLLKGLQDNADVKFESQLKSSSIHIANREKLYHLLTDTVKIDQETDILKGEPIASADAEFEHQQTVIESAKNSDQLIDEIEKDSGGLENHHENQAVSAHSHSILISSEAADSEGVMFVMDEETAEDETKIFYMDPGFASPENDDLLELDRDSARESIIDSEEANSELNSSDGAHDKKLSQNELIDKFILENPRIGPVRDTREQALVDISEPYTKNKEGLVTETLARIYISQGYYSRAIDIYEKLSLKYPEKSSYFAAQIEKVKEYLKK